MKKSNNIIEIKNLSYKNIFHDFNLNIEDGQFIAISGANNSGKSTLLKLISTLITTKNCITYKNIPIENINKNDLFSEIGLVLLDDIIRFSYSTVEEELFNILDNLKQDQKKKILEYQRVIKLLNIENYLTEDPNLLNKNVKIRILLAATLLSSPKVLLLDDICSMMTKTETKELLNILNKLNKIDKITIIMVTSNLSEVIEKDKSVDYLYILEKGSIAIEGKPLEVLKEDNKINKLGLALPFMIDLSVKLQDYNLLDEVILDEDRMVDKLWK